MDKEEIKDYIFQAVQSTKQENSGLVGDIMNRIDTSIGKAVETHVNGKIRNLTTMVETHIDGDTKWKKADMEWKKTYEVYLKATDNAYKGGSIIFKFILGIAALGSALFGIIKGLIYLFHLFIK